MRERQALADQRQHRGIGEVEKGEAGGQQQQRAIAGHFGKRERPLVALIGAARPLVIDAR